MAGYVAPTPSADRAVGMSHLAGRPTISVIVCSRNRADQLARCLHAFGQADAPPGAWELLVVDNGSTDHTREIVAQRSRAERLPARYLREDEPGLSRARNRGLAAAAGDLVAFTDDDCLVSPTWLPAIVRAFASDGNLMVLGGRVDLADPGDAPVGIRPFPDELHISEMHHITERLIGCNMAFRSDVFRRIGLFDPKLGAGTRIGSSEDLDMFYRARKAGMTLRYEPQVRVRHAHGRRPGPNLATLRESYVRGRGAFYGKHLLRGDRTVLKSAWYEIGNLSREMFSQRPAPAPDPAPARVLLDLARGAAARILAGR